MSTHVAEVKQTHESLENLDIVWPTKVVAQQRLVEPWACLQEGRDGLGLSLTRPDLQQAVLLEVGQAVLGLDIEAGGADKENPLLVLGGDESFGRWICLRAGTRQVCQPVWRPLSAIYEPTDGQAAPPVSTRSAILPTAASRMSRQMNCESTCWG